MKKNTQFIDFVTKATKRLDEKKKGKTATLHIPSLDRNISIRSLTSQEIIECMDSTEQDDMDYADKYTIYLATIEPSLRDVATELKNNGEIQEYIEVCDIFDMHEIRSISTEIMKLSGVFAENKAVTVVNELKN